MDASLAAKTKPSTKFSDILSGWLRVWTRIYQHSPLDVDGEAEKREVVAAYAGVLDGLTPQQLDAACRLATKACKFFPTPADIVEHIENAQVVVERVAGEKAWARVLELAPDFGCDYRIASAREPNDAALLFAARAAGGWRYIATCSERDLQFARKTFLEAYDRMKRLPEARRVLEPAQERALLAEINRRERSGVLAAPSEGELR
jgi:hypothetical protein